MRWMSPRNMETTAEDSANQEGVEVREDTGPVDDTQDAKGVGAVVGSAVHQSKAVGNVLSSAVTGTIGETTKQVKRMFGDDMYSFDELQAIEKRRRAIRKGSRLPINRILLCWDGTVTKALFEDPLFYITMLIYILVRIGARFGLPEFVADLGGADISIIGGFLSFLLIFFVVGNTKRFDVLYEASCKLKGRIINISVLARDFLPRARALRLNRYMNAMHCVAYVGVSETYMFENFFLPMNETHQFLTPDEVERMKEMNMNRGGNCYRELVCWCCAEILDAQKEGYFDSRTANWARLIVLNFRGYAAKIFNFEDQPISFFYVHFLCMLSVMYLPLYAVSAGIEAGTGDDAYWLNDVITGLIVLLQCVFIIGLRLLGQKLSDPYGSDIEDLSVQHYIHVTWIASNRLLRCRLPAPLDPEVEEALVRKHDSLGAAWAEEGTVNIDEDEAQQLENEPMFSARQLMEAEQDEGTGADARCGPLGSLFR